MTAPVKFIAEDGPLVILDGVIVGAPAQESHCLGDLVRRMPQAALPPRLEFEPFDLVLEIPAEQDNRP